MSHSEILQAVNDIRAVMGAEVLDELPAGERNNGHNCVLANALKDIDQSVLVYKEGIFSTNKQFSQVVANQLNYQHDLIIWKSSVDYRYGVPTPLHIRAFIANFDDGHYPELEMV